MNEQTISDLRRSLVEERGAEERTAELDIEIAIALCDAALAAILNTGVEWCWNCKTCGCVDINREPPSDY